MLFTFIGAKLSILMRYIAGSALMSVYLSDSLLMFVTRNKNKCGKSNIISACMHYELACELCQTLPPQWI